MITSKFEFLLAAAQAGLPVPELEICPNLPEAMQAANRMGYPVMIKLPVGAAGSGVRRVSSAEEFLGEHKGFAEGQSIAVQRFVEGAVGLTEVLYDHGKPICWASAYKRRCWPTAFAASCIREVMHHPDIEPLIEGIGALTGYHGFGGVDWIHDPATDRLHLVEFNARPTPGYHLGPAAGVSFADGVNQMLRGSARMQRPAPERAGRTLYMFPQSLHLAIDERSPRLFFLSLRDLPWRDPGLLVSLVRRVVSHYLPASVRDRARSMRQRHAV